MAGCSRPTGRVVDGSELGEVDDEGTVDAVVDDGPDVGDGVVVVDPSLVDEVRQPATSTATTTNAAAVDLLR